MKNIVITISAEHLDNLEGIADELKEEGVNIKNLHKFGVITGSVEDKLVEKISKRKEVEALTEEKVVRLPPPDSEIQ